jgi:hypothetical protein
MSRPPTSSPVPTSPQGASDEPEMTDEESVPSDGKDEAGEQMIEDLGRDLRDRPPPPSRE